MKSCLKRKNFFVVLVLMAVLWIVLTSVASGQVKWVEQAKVLASDGAAYDQFSYSVSISGDYAVVGAGGDDDKGSDSGSAYIFKRDGTSWAEHVKLTASDGSRNDSFGFSVSIRGDYCVVGASGDNGSTGSAYIFKRDTDLESWAQQQKLIASDGAAKDSFGFSVSISDNYCLVGAQRGDGNESNSGSAYIFTPNDIDPNNWIQQTKLTASDGQVWDGFGASVSISGDYAIIGSPSDDDDGSMSGAAYIFKRNGTSWIEQIKLTASDAATGDRFGFSVSISGDYCVIGAYSDADNGERSGSAYIFKRDGTSWIEQVKLTASDGEAGDFFGNSVSISGQYAIVGAMYDDDNGYDSGSAYIFKSNSDTWIEQAKLTASDGQGGDSFGWSVSTTGEYCLIGAPEDDDNGGHSGSAYIFFMPEPSNTAPVACIVGGDRTVEAGSGCEARVVLDGSCSSDADSTPGTNDDVEYFDWYEQIDPCDPNSDFFLGSGQIIDCNLPLGEHDIILEVIDKIGAFDSNEVTITVEDTTPPEFSLSVEPDVLWPANHKMVKITPSWEVSDICDESPDVSLVSITMNEDDDAKGDGHTTDDIQVNDDGIWLRAERSGKGTGRVYTITYRAVDGSGNVTVGSATVTVLHNQK